MSDWGFKFALWPTLAALAGIALTLALGNWQLNRAHEKTVLAQRLQSARNDALIEMPSAQISADELAWRRVQVHGQFEPKYTVFIDNRIEHGVAGYHVITPLRIGGSERWVLVNRGWIAGTNSRSQVPEIKTPAGTVIVVGLAAVPSSRFLELSPKIAEGNVWQNLTLERYRAAVPIAIQPLVIQQENDVGDGLARAWPEPDFGIQMHYGYAFQWFTLSAAILIYYLVTHVYRTRTQQPN